MRNALILTCSVVFYLNVALVFLLMLVSLLGFIMEHGLWGGMLEMRDSLNPILSPWSLVLTLVLLSPGFGALYLRDRLRRKHQVAKSLDES